MVFQNKTLRDALTGEIIRSWPDAEYVAKIRASKGEIWFGLADGTPMQIVEVRQGVWCGSRGTRFLAGGVASVKQHGEPLTEGRVHLPLFEGGDSANQSHPYAALLRILHHELLFNIKDGAPLPNLFVYDHPWYRHAAMACMVLEKTQNLHLVHDWITGLRDPFDRNNNGIEEPDNLGQLLYMISLVSDASHPLVPVILEQAQRFQKGNFISGLTDFEEHPVYQTKWLKFGLRSLGLTDEYQIPNVYDSYSSLFWWDFQDHHVPGPRFDAAIRHASPHLAWAEDHFYHTSPANMETLLESTEGPWGRRHVYIGPYPLTYAQYAPSANYAGMEMLNIDDARNQICRPYTWHAAEMFLYLLELGPVPDLDKRSG